MLLISLLVGTAVAAAPAAPEPALGPPAPPPPLLYVPSPPAPPPPPPRLPPPRRRGEVRPPFQRSGTIVNDDYPAAAIRAEEQGPVTIRMNVDSLGRVESCEVAASSGSAALDAASCSLAIRRFRFYPALDRRGRPAPGVAMRTIRWQLPDDSPPSPPLINGWVALALPPGAPGVAAAQCARTMSISLLDAAAGDLCAELLAPDGADAPVRPARRALLTFAGGIGGAPPAPSQAGRLVYREQAQFAVAADGGVVGCRTAVVVSNWRERPFDLCRFLDTTDAPYFSSGFPASQGRISLEVYE